MPEAVAAAPAAPAVPASNAPTNGATQQAPAEEVFEVKVSGGTKKYTKAEAIRLLSRVGYTDDLTKQAKEAIKAAQATREEYESKKKTRAERIKAGDLSALDEVLQEYGADSDAYARAKLERKLAEHQMTPEQREAAEAKAERDRLKKELDERTSKEAEARRAEAQKVVQQRMEAQLADAAEKAGLPKDADSFYAVYEAVQEWQRLKLPWDPERIVETAKENIEGSFKRLEGSVLKGLKGKALVERLGDAVVKEVLRYKVEELRNGTATRPPAAGVTTSTRAPAAPQTMSPQELMAKYRGG